MRQRDLPIAVIGAGPVGLAAAAHLLAAGETPLVLEAGDAVGANIRQWAHVPLFSPWHECLDDVSVEMLRRAGWAPPDPDAMPRGGEVVADYLEPLSRLPGLAPCVRLRRRVTSIARQDPGDAEAPFRLRVRNGDGDPADVAARAVIDASGTWTTPNRLGQRGLPASGEVAHGAAELRHPEPDFYIAGMKSYGRAPTFLMRTGYMQVRSVVAAITAPHRQQPAA